MKEKDFVMNENGEYSLSIQSQRLIPYFSQIFKKEVGVLPVILGIVRNKEKILLIQRKKMPYKGYWGLFGGKQINGETISQTIEREVFEESKIKAEFIKCNGVVYERLRENNQYKHSFLLIITTLQTNSTDAKEQDEGKVAWFDFEEVIKNKVSDIIPSDVAFLQKYSEKVIEIENVVMEECGQKLVIE
jgi:ADP-ribose pyrophosphatase YjhB (NUDIX family)